MKTVFEYTQSNILVIPQALYGMKDVEVIRSHGDAGIFYKCLEQDLVDVEFYTNVPCLVYIESGKEVLTDSNNQTIELFPESAIFFAQGLTLHSDYVKLTESLKAYLVFFDMSVATEFVTNVAGTSNNVRDDYCVFQSGSKVGEFFRGFHRHLDTPGYFNTKLNELLHLIAWECGKETVCRILQPNRMERPKRNLSRLLENHEVLHLSVADLSNLSGRSVSTFTRDFKKIYGSTPKQWLQEKRLAYAKKLLEDDGLSVTDTALQVGYENISNFIKAFKSRYKVTPKRLLKLE